GLLHTMQDPHLVANGSSEAYSYQYDSVGRKTGLAYPRSVPSATPTNESWHYDTVGRIDTFTNRNGNTQRTLYDNLNRAYNVSWDDSGLTPTVIMSYDVASRMTMINNTNANISHAYYDDNLLKSETSTITGDGVARTVKYAYDAYGNRGGTDDAGNVYGILYPNSAYTFNYDYTNRSQVWHIFSGSTTLATFVYDPDGNVTSR